MMIDTDITRFADAIRAAADKMDEGVKTDSKAGNMARLLRDLADGEGGRIHRTPRGRYVESMSICACCGAMDRWPAGWLIYTTTLDERHDIALPLCNDCDEKARADGAFVKAEGQRRDLPSPPRYSREPWK